VWPEIVAVAAEAITHVENREVPFVACVAVAVITLPTVTAARVPTLKLALPAASVVT
jgi:hypothetical protein